MEKQTSSPSSTFYCRLWRLWGVSICVHILAKKFELPSSSYAGCFDWSIVIGTWTTEE